MDQDQPQQQEEHAGSTWIRVMEASLGIALLIGAGFLAHIYAPPPTQDLRSQVTQLTQQVEELQQEQAMPAMVLNKYRNSICYIFGIYEVGIPGQRPQLRARISGTGFVVAKGLLATNRHVAEPWYGDQEAAALIQKGATPVLERLFVFFPGRPLPVDVTPIVVSGDNDLAVLKVDEPLGHQLRPLPLAPDAPSPGELVAVIGYPMGVLGMVAKSPPAVYERLAYRRDDMGAASELAALSLIRPSATCGHLGDVVGEKLIYDAPTAHGGSGGPVFNSHGEVIGINSAYIDGFSGGTLGISVGALKPLIAAAQKKPVHAAAPPTPAN
ncbi:MAG TPA: serine protease [Terriglobales bacterium]|nr:serine protease [Terriglobales bacterium]